MKNNTIVSIKNLTTTFNKKTPQEIKAIDNLSFNFDANKIHYIIGNSGSGKTTLVQHFNGLNKSDSGDIKIGEFEIIGTKRKIPSIKKLRSFVSIVFQYPEYQIFKDTIRNEIMFGPIAFGLHKKLFFDANTKKLIETIKKDKNVLKNILVQIKNQNISIEKFINMLPKSKIKFRKSKAIIYLLNLNKTKIVIPFNRTSMEDVITNTALKYLKKLGMPKEYLNYSPFGLSGGQKRRIAIAGILAIEPTVLIFDEPTAGLDPQGAKEMLNIIKEEKQNGRTLFIITHLMDEVLECGDNVIVLDKGQIIASGTPYEVFMNKNLYATTKIIKPKVINFIDELNMQDSRFKNLYNIKPRTCEELADAILTII